MQDTRISNLLKVLLLKSLLHAYLKSISEDERAKFVEGEQIYSIGHAIQDQKLTDAKKHAVKFYRETRDMLQRQVKERQVKIGESIFAQFVEILRLSGYPDELLIREDIFQTIVNIYMHLKRVSDGLLSTNPATPNLLQKLEMYSKLLAGFDREIVSFILQRLFKKDEVLVQALNATNPSSSHDKLSQFWSDLVCPHSADFKFIQACGIMNVARSEPNPIKLSCQLEKFAKIIENLACFPHGTTTELLMNMLFTLVPAYSSFLGETSVWKNPCAKISDSLLRKIDTAFIQIAQTIPRFVLLLQEDYANQLQKFPSSGFPHLREHLHGFVREILLKKYDAEHKLKK
jgi:hypothetical protein